MVGFPGRTSDSWCLQVEINDQGSFPAMAAAEAVAVGGGGKAKGKGVP